MSTACPWSPHINHVALPWILWPGIVISSFTSVRSIFKAASKIETTLVSTLGQGVGMKLLGKVFSLLPQLGGGGKEGVEHSAAHQRLLLSTISTLHNSLDTLLEHKVKEFPCARPTSTPLALPPCNGSGLERAALLSR